VTIRFARPTDRLLEVARFYEDGLGFERIGAFDGHSGYSGVILGIPDRDVQLEFLTHAGGSPGEAPTAENLLVLYLDDAPARDRAAERLRALGGRQVEAENPWWDGLSAVTFADPDGWLVVLVPSPWGG
jgi:catechol 2,3-dioxygenase-like lactoylglutathione lyase family enzyme